MKFRLFAAAAIALAAGAASAQPPGGSDAVRQGRGHGPGGFGLLEFDANADGKLTKAEFDAAQRARLNLIDANKDGTATTEEFQAARKAAGDARKADMIKTRFTALDTDKNGQISQAEFAAGAPGRDGSKGGPQGGGRHGKGAGPGGPQAAAGPDGTKRAGRQDADRDGKVTFSEFSAGGLEAFNRADANKDGTVTVAELQAMKPGRI